MDIKQLNYFMAVAQAGSFSKAAENLTVSQPTLSVAVKKLEEELRGSVDGVSRLVFDLAKLEYISSAGLRVLLAMQKLMNQQGEMMLQNVNEAVMEVFEVTGFSDILRIE
ncbi:MAG: LysR family transcriptional regulator [Clostridiales bacterium]|nr:LysR family transcriptional regulator [Clostridiales bacterium]